MSNLLPIIEELADAPDNTARARWLLACPFSIMLTYDMTIRNRLRHAGFLAGVEYVDAIGVVMRSTRDEHGDLRTAAQEIAEGASSVMRAIAHAQMSGVADADE